MLIGFGGTAQISGPSGGSNQDQHLINVMVPDLSLLAIRGDAGNSISLSPQLPALAGSDFSQLKAQDSSLWLNYSNIRSDLLAPHRNIYAKISNGQVPSGFQLAVAPSPSVGAGVLNPGTTLGSMVLSPSNTMVIQNIGTTFTGKGVGNGHRLVYTLSAIPGSTELIDFDQSSTIQIMYTIAD